MWRRWGNNRDPYIGNPTLIDTTMDERYLETIPEVDSIYSRRSSVATTALPELPFRAVPPMQQARTSLDTDRSVSVYSEHSAIIPEDIPEEPSDTSDSVPSVRSEVSPLSTPRASVDNLPVSPLVSPLDAPPQFSHRFPKPEPQLRSQIPRRKVPDTYKGNLGSSEEPKSNSLKEQDAVQQTKWDDFSGEPSPTGKAAVVRPGQTQPLEMQYPQLKERTKQILAGLRQRDNTQAKTWGKVPPPVDPDSLENPVQREPWKGASGRTTLVEPVKNTPRLEPLRIPQRNISRQATAVNSSPIRDSDEVPKAAPAASPAVPSPVLPTPATIRAVESQESIKPTVPLKLGNNTPRIVSPATVENTTSLQSPFQSPHFPDNQSIHEAVTTPKAPEMTMENPTLEIEEPLTPSKSTLRQDQVQDFDPNRRRDVGAKQIPKDTTSGLSWTTYTTTVNESPRSMAHRGFEDSPIQPMPTMSSPLVVRKRPTASRTNPSIFSNIDATISNTSIVSRKPVAERFRAVSLLSTASLSKSLPQCPPEMEAQDKISVLEARMDDLARRKRNLGKIIKELEAGLKRNSIAYDTRKRREVEKMIINLQLELAEVGQEEHEVGIRLHRAQKKRDKEDNYEQPTGLWIKRVTA